jgi:hypothetical protein
VAPAVPGVSPDRQESRLLSPGDTTSRVLFEGKAKGLKRGEKDSMLLEEHPKLKGKWPVEWCTFYDCGEKISPDDHPDTLVDVEEFESRNMIFLIAMYRDQEVSGNIVVDDPKLRARLVEKFQSKIGRSFLEVELIDLSYS